MSASITIDASELQHLIDFLDPWADFDTEGLMTAVAGLGELQTRRRIEEEKTAPDGSPWLPNAENTSILLKTGDHLRGSVAFFATSDEARWGASWPHAHVHQYGATIVPKSASHLVFKVGGKFAAGVFVRCI